MSSILSQVWILLLFTTVYLYYGEGKQCTSNGKFINHYNCSSYMVCNNIFEYDLACPLGFIVNYEDMVCSNSTKYKCEPSYKCTDIGNFTNPADEKNTSYITCIQGFGELIIAIASNCSDDYVYGIMEKKCVINQNKTDIQIIHTTNSADLKQCTSNGKFINSYSCDGYTVCNGVLQYNITCPSGHIVDYERMICSNTTNYHCEPDYKCTKTGNFTAEEADSYITCIKGIAELSFAISTKCPTNQVFSSEEYICVPTPKNNSATSTHVNFWSHSIITLSLLPFLSCHISS